MFRRTLTPSTAAALVIAASSSAGVAGASTDDPPAAPAAPAVVTAPKASGKPAIFDTRTYEEAKKAAEESGKWFIVKGTATWCPPCRVMDKTTWVDPKVVAWLEANAVAYALDVDKERSIATSLEIQAMPTMIAFKDGKEFDRVVGGHPPEPFLDWLEGIGRGEKSIEEVRRNADRPKPDGNVDIQARYRKAQALARSGGGEALDEAIQEFVWLWTATKDEPGFGGVRGSFMASEMGRLAQRNAKAMAAFTKLRDDTARGLDGAKIDPEELDDWIVLNEVIGDEAATLEWFDRVKGDRRWKPMLARSSFRLINLLETKGRWADLGSLVDDPVAQIRRDYEFMEHIKALDAQRDQGNEEEPAHLKTMMETQRKRRWLESASRTYVGVLSDGREEAALAAAIEAMRLDPDPALLDAFVELAMEAGQPRAVQLGWIDAALARRGTDPAAVDAALTPVQVEQLRRLRPKLEKALANAKPAAGSGAGKTPAP